MIAEFKIVVNINFPFNDLRRMNKIVYTFLSLCGELGKECTRFPLHRWYRHYLRPNFLTRLLPTHANSCFLFTSCNHLRAFNHSYY